MKAFSEKMTLIWPPFFWLLVLFILPILLILIISFSISQNHGGYELGFTLEHYAHFFDALYFKIFLRSIGYAISTTVLTLLIAFPMAYYISFRESHVKYKLMLLVLIPFWTNFLIRTFSWVNILGYKGLINNVLMYVGIIDSPLILLHTSLSVNIGLVYSELPYMILPILASIDRLDKSLLEASTDLGANKWQTFKNITFPLSFPGVITGIIFVFIPTLGQFVVPDILGGKNSYMIGNVITNQFLVTRNWPFGSAISISIMVLVLILMIYYLRNYGDRGQIKDFI